MSGNCKFDSDLIVKIQRNYMTLVTNVFQELRSYMLKYGGRFENYFSRHRVTHIICSNLPDSKVKNLRFDLIPFFKF